MSNAQKYLDPLVTQFALQANSEKAAPMEAYMKHLFPFLGITSPDRKVILRAFLKDSGKPDPEITSKVVDLLWARPEREFHYVGMELASRVIKKLDTSFLSTIELMITNKSWWDTVDFIASNLAGVFFQMHPDMLPEVPDRWNESENMWLNRTALLFQLKYGDQTDHNLLASYILRHANSKEFFHRKAIGWSLRQYSKFNAEWVTAFINEHKDKLSNLSVREGLKHINR